MTGNSTLRQRRSPGNASNNLQGRYYDENNLPTGSQVVGSIGGGSFPSDELKNYGNYDEKQSLDYNDYTHKTTSSGITNVGIDRLNERKDDDPSSSSTFAEAVTIKHGNYTPQQIPFPQTSYHSTELNESEHLGDSRLKQDTSSNRMERILSYPSGVENMRNNCINDPTNQAIHPYSALGFLSFGASLLVLMVHFTHILPSSRRSNHDAIVVMCSMLFGGILQVRSVFFLFSPTDKFLKMSFPFLTKRMIYPLLRITTKIHISLDFISRLYLD
jgi:hypothetical protein